jgi:hypothetical protein
LDPVDKSRHKGLRLNIQRVLEVLAAL